MIGKCGVKDERVVLICKALKPLSDIFHLDHVSLDIRNYKDQMNMVMEVMNDLWQLKVQMAHGQDQSEQQIWAYSDKRMHKLFDIIESEYIKICKVRKLQ